MFVATFCFLTHFTLTTGKVMFYATEFQALEDYSSVSTYQGFARSSLVSALLLLCYTQSVYKRIMIVMMSIFVLFFLGARSELYGFVFLLTMFLMAFSNKSLLRLVLSIGLLAAIAFIVVSNFEWLSESRQFEIMNLSQSTSMVGRLEFQEVGLGQLADNPVFGFFGGHIVDTGSVGGYVHNALSAWLAFGILGFVVYMSLTVVATLNSLFFFVKYRTLSSHWTFAFMVNCFCLLMMITSKSVYWILPGLGWGLYINAMVRQNSEKNVHLGNTLKLFVEPN
ncbi:MAG: O-antigen ligase family protein [Smithella sp.]